MWKFLNKIIRELLFSTLTVEGGTCKHVLQRPFKLKRRKCRSGMRAADKFDFMYHVRWKPSTGVLPDLQADRPRQDPDRRLSL